MEYISSDTNVWIDFATIGKTEMPFRLPYTYIMSEYVIDDELLSPEGFREELLSYGLLPVEITDEEFFLAERYGSNYRKLSVHDRIALAIAKSRHIILLTGDGALRKAANNENISVIGTLGILDQLRDMMKISEEEYESCLYLLLDNNGGAVRLPESEILERIRLLGR